jgi:hypothetical protein
MNERMQAIEQRAWEIVDNTWDWANPVPSKETLFKAAFAKLIVQECLNIVEPDVGMECGDEWYTTLKGTAQEIREHFGVTE